jgi:hypothetical protein
MFTRDDYLRFSDQCIRIAEEVTSPEHRDLLLDMAKRWRELAEDLGTNGQAKTPGRIPGRKH